jgi:hypothetical protein
VVVVVNYWGPTPTTQDSVNVDGREFTRAWNGGRVSVYLPVGDD